MQIRLPPPGPRSAWDGASTPQARFVRPSPWAFFLTHSHFPPPGLPGPRPKGTDGRRRVCCSRRARGQGRRSCLAFAVLLLYSLVTPTRGRKRDTQPGSPGLDSQGHKRLLFPVSELFWIPQDPTQITLRSWSRRAPARPSRVQTRIRLIFLRGAFTVFRSVEPNFQASYSPGRGCCRSPPCQPASGLRLCRRYTVRQLPSNALLARRRERDYPSPGAPRRERRAGRGGTGENGLNGRQLRKR